MKRLTSYLAVMTMLAFAAASGSALASGGRSDQAFQFKIGGFFPSGDSSFWNETSEVFTLDSDDFTGAEVGFTYLSSLSNNLEVGFNVDFFDETVLSAYRDYVDADGFSIFHDTSLTMMPVSVDVRFLPAGRYGARGERGRVMVRRPVFYMGGGAGIHFFEYEEIGDFVDFDLDEVIFDHFRDRGAAISVHALAGVELPISPQTALLFEGKYSWVDEDLGSDFQGLGNLDLGGTSLRVGLSFSF